MYLVSLYMEDRWDFLAVVERVFVIHCLRFVLASLVTNEICALCCLIKVAEPCPMIDIWFLDTFTPCFDYMLGNFLCLKVESITDTCSSFLSWYHYVKIEREPLPATLSV